MLKNFFKVACRNLVRNKGFSFINITGLAVGMASAGLILMWVQNELSYDGFYRNSDRLYEAWNKDMTSDGTIGCWNVTPKILAPTLKKDYPEVEKATRLGWDETILFSIGEKKLNVTGTMVDPDFLTMFEFPFLKGDMHNALNDPEDIVVTRKLAVKLFGTQDAMGRAVVLDNKFNFVVTGILKDLPNNTQFDFEFLLPWSYMSRTNQDDSGWSNNSTRNLVLLKTGVSLKAFNGKIKNVIISHGQKGWTTQEFLYPVKDLRLYSNFENGVPTGGKIETVRIFVLIAVFILLIACINFMNMSTARSERRAKEVGIRKVVGARKNSLISQFLGESILVAFIAGTISLGIVQLCLPSFNLLTKKALIVDYSGVYFWSLFIGFVLVTGLLAGSYPAFFLSSFRPVSVLKGTFRKINALVTPRKVLVVLQFTFAIIMIVCTLIIEKQIRYARQREAGYDKDNIIYSFLDGGIKKNYELIRNELLQQGIASSVSKTSAPLTEGWSSGGATWSGRNPNDRTEFNFYNVDGNIVKTAGLQLVEGRDIDVKKYPSDSTAVVLNQSAVRIMGFKHPIGQIIDQGQWDTSWHVVGVVKDFILQSPYDRIKPMVIQGPHADWFNLVHIKFNRTNSTSKNLAAAEKIFRRYNPQYPFEYHFIDEAYAKKFEDEQTTGILTAFFAGLTIFISCLGLFGLAAYMAESRIKEIGVRKVLGASLTNIVSLISKDFLKLILIAILIASPLAWIAMDKWLGLFNYRIDIPLWIFLISGLLAMVIALLTVSFQAIKAALLNPVKCLRSE